MRWHAATNSRRELEVAKYSGIDSEYRIVCAAVPLPAAPQQMDACSPSPPARGANRHRDLIASTLLLSDLPCTKGQSSRRSSSGWALPANAIRDPAPINDEAGEGCPSILNSPAHHAGHARLCDDDRPACVALWAVVPGMSVSCSPFFSRRRGKRIGLTASLTKKI